MSDTQQPTDQPQQPEPPETKPDAIVIHEGEHLGNQFRVEIHNEPEEL